jgi:hypothetical protein
MLPAESGTLIVHGFLEKPYRGKPPITARMRRGLAAKLKRSKSAG